MQLIIGLIGPIGLIRPIKNDIARNIANRFLGGYAEGVTPVPISNTEVKPLRADGTARVAVWESRSPPGINENAPSLDNKWWGVFALGEQNSMMQSH